MIITAFSFKIVVEKQPDAQYDAVKLLHVTYLSCFIVINVLSNANIPQFSIL